MAKTKLPAWDDERTNTLVSIVGDESPVSQETVAEAAVALETTNRSVAAKLRKMEYEVESSVQVHKKTFTDEEEAELREFVVNNEGEYTFAEIAAHVFGDAERARQVQGKLLSMDLNGYAKPTPKKEVEKKYTDEQEAKIEEMAKNGDFLEDIAEALGKDIKSIRGKCLSMLKSHGIEMPKQRDSHKKENVDPLEALGEDVVVEMTVAEIAKAIGKTERGVKTMLTHRKLVASDYDGAKRAAKIAAAKDKQEA